MRASWLHFGCCSETCWGDRSLAWFLWISSIDQSVRIGSMCRKTKHWPYYTGIPGPMVVGTIRVIACAFSRALGATASFRTDVGNALWAVAIGECRNFQSLKDDRWSICSRTYIILVALLWIRPITIQPVLQLYIIQPSYNQLCHLSNGRKSSFKTIRKDEVSQLRHQNREVIARLKIGTGINPG